MHWFALARCVEAVRSSCSLFGVDGGAAGGCDKPAEHRGAKHANQAPWRRAHLLSQAGQGLAGAQGSHAAAAAGGWQCGGNLGEGRGETEGRGVPLQHSMLASGVVPRSAARGRGGGASSTRQPTGFSVGWGLGGGGSCTHSTVSAGSTAGMPSAGQDAFHSGSCAVGWFRRRQNSLRRKIGIWQSHIHAAAALLSEPTHACAALHGCAHSAELLCAGH